MYCKKCGKVLEEGVRFCPACGAEQQAQYRESTATESNGMAEEPIEDQKPAKVWSVFSTIGKIVGIVAICLCWVPYSTIFFGVVAIVFSCLGKKYHTEQTDKNFKIGLTLGIIAVVVSFLVGLILNIISAVMGYAQNLVIFEFFRQLFNEVSQDLSLL